MLVAPPQEIRPRLCLVSQSTASDVTMVNLAVPTRADVSVERGGRGRGSPSRPDAGGLPAHSE